MRIAAAIALALAAWSAPALTQGQLGERAAVAVDPQRAYIFYRASRKMGILFLRETPAEEQAADRAAALAAAQAQYQRNLVQWRRLDRICRGGGGPVSRCRRLHPEPDAPTPDNVPASLTFARNIAAVERNPPFTEEDREYSYLLPVEPGRYILYGQRDVTTIGVLGVCLCMGSVSFEAGAGRIVDLGTITYPGLDAAGASRAFGLVISGTGSPSIAIVPLAAGASLPGRLAGLPVVPAEFRAAGKLPNHYGLYIDRHPAMPGVLAYERDRVIDARTGRPVAPGR